MGDTIMTGASPPEEELIEDNPPFPLTVVDKWVLAQTDEEFIRHDWQSLRDIIAANDLAAFKRTPSDLRRYMKWTREILEQYGSITSYILANRLPAEWGQPPFKPNSAVPFADPSDYKVLLNDWPYALESGATHLVVWSRSPIATDGTKGDMTSESRALVENFVQRYFIDPLGPGGDEKVLWFKNWVALQSVRSLEHFHVIVRGVDDDMLERWTGERRKAT